MIENDTTDFDITQMSVEYEVLSYKICNIMSLFLLRLFTCYKQVSEYE